MPVYVIVIYDRQHRIKTLELFSNEESSERRTAELLNLYYPDLWIKSERFGYILREFETYNESVKIGEKLRGVVGFISAEYIKGES